MRILTHMGENPGPWMIDTATALYDRAHADGWTDDGVGGIVYTLDPTGVVAAPQRMHWVVCEAASAARVLAEVVDPSRAEDLAVDYARAVAWADSHARAGDGTLDPRSRARRLRLHARVGGTPRRPHRRPHAGTRRRPDPSHSHRRNRRPLRLPARPQRVLLTARPGAPASSHSCPAVAYARRRGRESTTDRLQLAHGRTRIHMILSA